MDCFLGRSLDPSSLHGWWMFLDTSGKIPYYHEESARLQQRTKHELFSFTIGVDLQDKGSGQEPDKVLLPRVPIILPRKVEVSGVFFK